MTTIQLGWKELQKRALAGDPEAIKGMIASLEQISDDTNGAGIDLENAEWEVNELPIPFDGSPSELGQALRALGELREEYAELEEKYRRASTNYGIAYRDFQTLLESITDRLREAVRDGALTYDEAESIAADLGAKPPKERWTVTVDVQITIEGVEGEESDIEQAVREAISIDVNARDLGDDADENVDITGIDVTSEY